MTPMFLADCRKMLRSRRPACNCVASYKSDTLSLFHRRVAGARSSLKMRPSSFIWIFVLTLGWEVEKSSGKSEGSWRKLDAESQWMGACSASVLMKLAKPSTERTGFLHKCESASIELGPQCDLKEMQTIRKRSPHTSVRLGNGWINKAFVEHNKCISLEEFL